ncbi:MAG: hypothetical protein NC908_02565 [Candidatus Omnitrophica bacterium]|nr:hypothetical protein [Candidatus Omnitrophota bacterium]
MINIDFSLAISGYILITLLIVFLPWFFSPKNKDRELSLDPHFIWHCSICTYTYINTKQDNISVCPRCGSYNKR